MKQAKIFNLQKDRFYVIGTAGEILTPSNHDSNKTKIHPKNPFFCHLDDRKDLSPILSRFYCVTMIIFGME
jgi:hypothetical protein